MKAAYPLLSDEAHSVIVDLPNYRWNHTAKYWYKREVSKDGRVRKVPHRDLGSEPSLGASMDTHNGVMARKTEELNQGMQKTPETTVSPGEYGDLLNAFLDDNIPVLTHPIMALQTIAITYSDGKYLSLVDAASRTPLYHVEVCRQALQMEMIRLSPAPSDDTIKRFPRMRTNICHKFHELLVGSAAIASLHMGAGPDRDLGDFRLVNEAEDELDRRIDKYDDLGSVNIDLSSIRVKVTINMERMEMMDSTAMPHRSNLKVFAIMVALSLSMFVAALDQTIMATAIPTIAAKLHSAAGYTWIGGAYLLANAAGACIWAKLSDIWGRKPILLLAVAWFFGSSIICATAVDMPMLIAGRALQGVAGGGLLQLVTIVISDLFSVRHRSLYLGLMEFMWALAGGIGPLLGGAFSQYVSWRWSYWVNLPVCGLAFVLLLLFLDVHNPKTKMMDGVRAIDWFGSLSILGLTLMLLLGLDFGGETFPWDSPKVICLIVFGSLCSLLFIYSEKRLAKYPLMPMSLFGQTSNVATLAVAFAHGFVFIAGEYYVPLYLQSVKEASPMRSGVLVLPLVLSEAFAGIITGALIHRTGRYRELIWLGMTLLTIGNGLYIHLDAYSSLGRIIGYQFLSGIGAGFLFEPPIIAIQAMVSQDETATATATVGFIRNLATSASIVIGGVVFQNSMRRMKPTLLAAGMSETLTEQMSGDSAAANIEMIKTIEDATQLLAVKEAFASSLRNMWILYTCMSALGIVAGVFILKTRLNKEHVETRTGLRLEKTEATTVLERPADQC
ncbi:hypothetical protein KXV43_001647 [Aspergillus fumigatus]|nr:hypothetical protein KXV43_001647 [Aspergillus fumigatus]